jgi:hypothetical protein
LASFSLLFLRVYRCDCPARNPGVDSVTSNWIIMDSEPKGYSLALTVIPPVASILFIATTLRQ